MEVPQIRFLLWWKDWNWVCHEKVGYRLHMDKKVDLGQIYLLCE